MNKRRVFGVGLPKTGTTTLKAALERLGYSRVADFEMQDCERFLHGDFQGLVRKLADHDAALDWPWPLIYQPLSHAFPDALFVLTVREDEATWLRSMQLHAKRMSGTRRAA